MNKRTVKTKIETKGKTTTKKTTKVQVEPGKRMEETIVIQRKVNPYIDNYSYKETKNIYKKNPRFQVIVEHKRKGDIIGGSFEETKFQRQVFSQGGSRPKLPEQNQKLRANKSEVKMPKTQTSTTKKITTTRTTKEKNPVTSSAKKEKITETSVKRRSEGTGSKTETKTQSKTTTTGVRGQPTTSSTSTKTTIKTTKIEGGASPEGGAGTSVRRKFVKK